MDSPKTVKLKEDKSSTLKLRLLESIFILLLRGLHTGQLHIIFPSGCKKTIGDSDHTIAYIHIKNGCFFKKVLTGGSVGFGESYEAGDWDTPDLSNLLFLLAVNQSDLSYIRRGFSLIRQQIDRFYHKKRRNSLERSKRNIQDHYDLSNDFYKTFLDRTMTYSSAFFCHRDDSLEKAQINKIDRMLDLAGVVAEDKVLEIGSGWGALALRAAQRGCRVKTITLSKKQFTYAKDLFEREGVSDRVEIALEDYRVQKGQYDAVLSCEMIEAVGYDYLASYFKTINHLLRSKRNAVIQAITIPDERYQSYSRRCDWIQKHIFPGGHLPSLGAIYQHVASAGKLQILHTHRFGSYYAETLRRWAESFNKSEDLVNSLGFDISFRRKWNFYLSYCQAGFSAGLIDVQHIKLVKS